MTATVRYWDILALDYSWVLGVDVGDRIDRHAISLWRGPVLYQVKLYQVLGDDEDGDRGGIFWISHG
jgi:hypothetical protein